MIPVLLKTEQSETETKRFWDFVGGIAGETGESLTTLNEVHKSSVGVR